MKIYILELSDYTIVLPAVDEADAWEQLAVREDENSDRRLTLTTAREEIDFYTRALAAWNAATPEQRKYNGRTGDGGVPVPRTVVGLGGESHETRYTITRQPTIPAWRVLGDNELLRIWTGE